MAKKTTAEVRLYGNLIILPDCRVKLLDPFVFKATAKKHVAKIRVLDVIVNTLEDMYGYPVHKNNYIFVQPMYEAMTEIVQEIPEWQMAKTISSEKIKKENLARKIAAKNELELHTNTIGYIQRKRRII